MMVRNAFSVFLFLFCGSLAVDPNYLGGNGIFSIPLECTKLLKGFAQHASNFTMCSIENARPVRLCEKCISDYVQFHSIYNEMSTTVINGSSCLSMFISHDRLDAIKEYQNNILSIWDKGNCNDCFTWTLEGPVISNKTKEFTKLFNTTMDCIVNNWNTNDTDIVCEKCMQPYSQLDKLYRSLSPDAMGIENVCMDIVDSMNTTRFIWSKTLNCCKLRRSPEIVFLCCTAVISILPILFYISVRFCGPIRDLPNVLKQSRFRQKFSRNGRDR